ncbi:MAG: ABC transporter substrate-binding protein [Acidimicrobiia bacterium]
MPAVRGVLVTALSGPLGRFGRAGVAAFELWSQSMPEGVELQVIDAHPDPAQAIRTAPQADVLFGPYGAGPAVRAAGATDRVMWNHGGATVRLSRPGFSHVVNVPAPASTYFEGVVRAVRTADPGCRSILVVHAATGFAREVAEGALSAGAGLDLTRIEYPPGRTAELQPTEADLLLVAGPFDDEVALVERLLPGGWRWAAFVGAGVEEVLPPELREGLLGPAQWLAEAVPDPDEGPTPEWFVGVYQDRTGTRPPYPAAQAFAAGVLWAAAAREAGTLDDQAVLEAAFRLRCRTLFGEFRLDPRTGIQVGQRLLAVQWQEGRRRVVWPPDLAAHQARPLG